MATETALICLDTSIVAGTKADQAVWILQEAVKERDEIVNRYMLLDVSDDESKVAAEKGIMFIRKTRKSQDAGRKEWGAPLDLVKKTLDKAMREHVDDPEREVEEMLLGKVGAYTRRLEDERRQREEAARKAAEEAMRLLREAQAVAEAKAKAEADAKGVEFVPPPPQGIPEVIVKAEPVREIPKAEGISYRRVWSFEVVDMTQVPDAYTKRIVNEEAVKAAIGAATSVPAGEKLSQCTAVIPGIRIYHEDRPIVR